MRNLDRRTLATTFVFAAAALLFGHFGVRRFAWVTAQVFGGLTLATLSIFLREPPGEVAAVLTKTAFASSAVAERGTAVLRHFLGRRRHKSARKMGPYYDVGSGSMVI